MGKLSIHCENCGSDWVVYHRDDWKNWKARTCPVCGKEIDPGTWGRSVLKGFGEMEDAQIELVKDHNRYHIPLFTISYLPDVEFPDKGNKEEIDQLKEEIECLKEGVDRIHETMSDLISTVILTKGVQNNDF